MQTRIDEERLELLETRSSSSGLDASSSHLQGILNGLPALIGYWDRSLHNRMANDAYIDFFGFSPAQMHGIHIREVLGEELFAMNLPYMERALAGEPQLFDRAIPDPQGQTRYTQASYVPDMVDGEVQGFLVLVTDITRRREAEIALDDERRRVETVLDAVSDAVLSVDLSLIITGANRAAVDLLGVSSTDLVGRDIRGAVPICSAAGSTDLEAACFEAVTHDRTVVVEHTCFLMSMDDQTRSVDFRVIPVRTAMGLCEGLVITIDDVTDARRFLEETVHRAWHDPLTGLSNREYLRTVEFTDDASVLFCDLDGFKQANDACGHQIGDTILRELADVLRGGIRSGDHLIRQGGDEFVIVLPNCQRDDAVRIAAQLIVSVEATHFSGHSHDFVISLSVGVAPPGVGANMEEMLAEADKACYTAKRNGGGRVETAADPVERSSTQPTR